MTGWPTVSYPSEMSSTIDSIEDAINYFNFTHLLPILTRRPLHESLVSLILTDDLRVCLKKAKGKESKSIASNVNWLFLKNSLTPAQAGPLIFERARRGEGSFRVRKTSKSIS